LGSDALGAGFDHEGLFGAGEAGEVKQHWHSLLPRLRRLKDSKPHRQADYGRLLAVEALHPIEASVLADSFEHHGYSMNAAVAVHTLYKSTCRRSLHPQLCHNVQRLTQSCQIRYARFCRGDSDAGRRYI
jgi:hypothetical protein